jgi:hypothetical protein
MLELMPDGTFKKLSKLQTEALGRYYKREKGNILETVVPSLLPSIIFGAVATAGIVVAWSYLKGKDLPTGDDVGRWVAGGIATVYSSEPKSSETITLPDGTTRKLTRCQRWEQDAVNWQIKKESGIITLLMPFAPQFKIWQATEAVHIIRSMKREGCGRSLVFTPEQWKEAQL